MGHKTEKPRARYGIMFILYVDRNYVYVLGEEPRNMAWIRRSKDIAHDDH